MIPFSQLINASQPGTMVQHLFSLDGGQVWTAGLAIRESSKVLAKLPARVDILSRGAIIQVEEVHLILLMLYLNGRIYESFVSIQHEDSAEFVTLMSRQETLSIHFFDGLAPHPVRALLTQNGFQPLFAWVQQTFMSGRSGISTSLMRRRRRCMRSSPVPKTCGRRLASIRVGLSGC